MAAESFHAPLQRQRTPQQSRHLGSDDFSGSSESSYNANDASRLDLGVATNLKSILGTSVLRRADLPVSAALGHIFKPSLCDDSPHSLLNPRISPDGSDMRLPSAGLSSAPSAPSSAVGSPSSTDDQLGRTHDMGFHCLVVPLTIVSNDHIDYFPSGVTTLDDPRALLDCGGRAEPAKTSVDPSLIHSNTAQPPMPLPPFDSHYPEAVHRLVASSKLSSPQQSFLRTSSSPPYLQTGSFLHDSSSLFASAAVDDRGCQSSASKLISPPTEYRSGDDSKEKQRCMYTGCGKIFKDIKAHMLTHQNERPEKCPIQTCEYHVKGFARKYDKNRHTLTHYKGSMVCGFCPGSGSPAEKSFNRADVFKRHLTAVHGVEQTPPNSRKRTSMGLGIGSVNKLASYAPDATGKCSTCSKTFANAQEFYEHLDDCVLRVVQEEDPAESINVRRLAEVEDDQHLHQTLEKNNLPTGTQMLAIDDDDDDNHDDADCEMELLGKDVKEASVRTHKFSRSFPSLANKSPPLSGVQKFRYAGPASRSAVPVRVRGRRSRRAYPSSWGFGNGQMTIRKRVVSVFDGNQRLASDDLMLSTDHEVRLKLADGKSYVTDLDVQTLQRAEASLEAADEDMGTWESNGRVEERLKEMLKASPVGLG